MHRVLQIDEILHLIFENILPDFGRMELYILIPGAQLPPTPDTAAIPTLLNAALTCHSFAGPALDTLWWAMDDLQALFSLLPGFQKEEIMGQETFTISGPILEGDCKRFFEYAKRIRFYDIARPDNIHTSAYVQVLRASGHTCLLPSLKYLRCTINTAPHLFLISPCLRAVTLYSQSASMQSTPSDIHAFIDELGLIAPKLVSLGLKTVVTGGVLDAIGRMSHLAYLSLRGVDGHSFSTKAAFESLSASATNLCYLHLVGTFDFDDRPSPSSLSSFPNLGLLLLGWKGLPAVNRVTSFLHGKKFPSLVKIRCSVALTSTTQILGGDNFSEFLKTLGQATDFRVADLDFGQYRKSHQLKVGPTITDLPILAQFRLTTFRIPFLNSVSPADITFIIESWPNLVDLELRSLGSQKPRFIELLKLAKGLSGLQSLGMELSSREMPDVENIPVLRHTLKNLKLRLFVTESEVDDPARLDDPVIFARGIDKLFPNLGVPTCSFMVPDGFDLSPWTRIALILCQLQGSRNDQALRVDDVPKSNIDSDLT